MEKNILLTELNEKGFIAEKRFNTIPSIQFSSIYLVGKQFSAVCYHNKFALILRYFCLWEDNTVQKIFKKINKKKIGKHFFKNRGKKREKKKEKNTVDSHLFELAVIRSSRLFEEIFISLVILPLGKSSVIQN